MSMQLVMRVKKLEKRIVALEELLAKLEAAAKAKKAGRPKKEKDAE